MEEGLSIGKATDEANPLENNVAIGVDEARFNVPPQVYIDDVGILNANVKKARENGILMSRAYEMLSLRGFQAVSKGNFFSLQTRKFSSNTIQVHQEPEFPPLLKQVYKGASR